MGQPWYPWQTLKASGRNRWMLLVKEAGYVTQLLGDCLHLMKSRFNIGFDGFHYLRGQEGVCIEEFCQYLAGSSEPIICSFIPKLGYRFSQEA